MDASAPRSASDDESLTNAGEGLSEGTPSIGVELRELARLGGPIMLSYAGTQLASFVDTAMIGRLDAASLGGVGIGSGIYFTLSLVAMGLALGMAPIASQAIGAGDHARARLVLWQTVRVAVLSSFPCMALILLIGAFIGKIGIDPETSGNVFRYLLGRFFNVLPFLLFVVGRTYLQAIGRPSATVWAVVWMNIANVIGNVLFIFGDDGLARIGLPRIGLPAMGAFGAGLSSTIAAFAMVAVIFGAVRRHTGLPALHDLRADAAIQRSIARVGWPIGMHLLAEVGAFTLAGIFAGMVGPRAVAGHQVALGLASMSFVIALGLADATAVRVGYAVGRRDRRGVRRAGAVGMATGAFFMSLSALTFALAPRACAMILSDKPDIIEAAVPLLRIAAIFQLADALQAIAAGAMRGTGDTRSAQMVNMIGHYLVGIPLTLLLCFGLQLGAPGIWWGLTAALFCVAVPLALRFVWVSRHEIRPL